MPTKSTRQILEEAINDYPKEKINTSEELLSELHKSVQFPITCVKLKEYLSTLDLSKHAWEAESIASLLQLFEDKEDETLEKIIDIIEKK